MVLDDLTGEQLGDDAVTVTFALEGISYELDLTPSAAADFRELLEPYIEAGRRTGRATRGAAAPAISSGEQAAARAWLSEQGIEVPSRGRISAALMERYENR